MIVFILVAALAVVLLVLIHYKDPKLASALVPSLGVVALCVIAIAFLHASWGWFR